MNTTIVPSECLLSVPDAAQRLGISQATIRAWILARKIEFVRIADRVLIKPETIDGLIKAGTVPVGKE